MVKTQYSYVERNSGESGQSGTATYDLPEKDFMDEIVITATATPTASTAPALPLSDALTKIEVTDGGTIIKSLSANQIKGLSMIHGQHKLSGQEWNKNATEHYDNFIIDLGMTLDNTRFAPDMAAFSNPQIKITWDYSLTTTEFGMTCDADSDPSMKFTVLAKMLREGPTVSHGYIRSQPVYEFTQSTSTTTVTEIPRKYPIVGIGVEAGYDNKDFTDDVNEVKLDFDNGSWIPFNLYHEEIPFMQQQWFRDNFQYSWETNLESSDEFDTHMGYLSSLAGMATSGSGRALEFEAGNQGVDTFYLWDLATPTETDEYQPVYLTAQGWMPFHMWYMPSSAILTDEKDTFDSTDYGRIELETTSNSDASTSSTPSILLEELVR